MVFMALQPLKHVALAETQPHSSTCIMTWWTIGMLLLTNLFTIYIHFSHTLAGVVITSPTLLYLPSNPLQPHSIACMSFQIIARIFTLICWWFFMASQPLKHVASAETQPHSSTCINRLIEYNQSLKLGLLWISDLSEPHYKWTLSFIQHQNPPLAP